MGILISLVIALIIFIILWYVISIIPFPEPIAKFRWLFYVLLCLVAVIWLLHLLGIAI